MGERKVPVCDIFGTLQPKGLRQIHVEVTDTEDDDSLFVCDIAASKRGVARILRMVENACYAPKKREAKADV